MYIITCDVNIFAKFLWSAINKGVGKRIFTSTTIIIIIIIIIIIKEFI